ncbi:polysaccharide biosynthesis/export family protein [Sulfuricaulis sp.]|jgi:polysaccharide export outer membrane protein|uniref:polysaccharide biosynthesis/export family protein n=1 Tax=Sulfuricaulis sp. TaxID=2003553 RepID=UPI00355A9A10
MKILTIALFLFLAACSSMSSVSTASDSTPTEKPAEAGASAVDSYVIQPGDMLEISVWKEKDLQKESMVRPDGGLNFPLTGDIIVSGLTIEQLRKELTAKLTKYVPDPVVTVSIKQSLGNKIYVTGKVNKPGDYIVTRNVDVMQALSMAGGLTAYASENKIKILRRVNGEQKVFLFKYSKVEKGEDLEQNIVLQGGDIVVVP